MHTKEIRTLCLKHVYGATLTDTERALVDDYAQTADGKDYLRECQEMKDLLKHVADVRIKPCDHQAMVERFERTVRQTFKQTVFRPWGTIYFVPLILMLLACLLFVVDGSGIIIASLLGSSVLWLIAEWFQRYYFAKILSRPDLSEYAKASRRRSDRILKSLPGRVLAVVLCGLVIAAVSYGAYWGYREFGFIDSAIVILVLVGSVAIIVFQFRKLNRSDREVWDWWAAEIKE